MRIGKVMYWDDLSGTGTLIDNETKELFFVHYSAIQSNSEHKSLTVNSKVRFSTYNNAYSEKTKQVIEII